MAFELPPLTYDYAALEPHIDTQTMQIHHDKHHQAYVTNLNNALQGHEFANLQVEEVLKRLNEVPENVRPAVRNNAGGHTNHTMFWTIMGPNGGGEPTGEFNALDAESGELLWQFQCGSGHHSSPSTYSIDGRQYIVVTSGFGGWAEGFLPGMLGSSHGSSLFAFALPE